MHKHFILLQCLSCLFGNSFAGVLGGQSGYTSLLPRGDDIEDACFPPCGPTTCGTELCSAVAARSTNNIDVAGSSNSTRLQALTTPALERRKFEDPIYDLQVTTYVAEQAKKISPQDSIKPGTGSSRPSHCILRKFGDLDTAGQHVFGTPPDQRIRGCTVMTLVSSRAVYMCHLYETYHFTKTENQPFLDLQPIVDLINGGKARSPQLTGDVFDPELFKELRYGATLYTMSPQNRVKRGQQLSLKHDSQVTALENAFLRLLPHLKTIRFPYLPATGSEPMIQKWQGFALLEWDPDINGLGIGIGTAQWRLWYENAYITGLVEDGLDNCLSTVESDDAPELTKLMAAVSIEDDEAQPVTDSGVPEARALGGRTVQEEHKPFIPSNSQERRHPGRQLFKRRTPKDMEWLGKKISLGFYPPPRQVKGSSNKFKNVDRFWTFEARTDPPGSCPTRVRHLPAQLTDQIGFHTEHILEAQLIKSFLEYVCGIDTFVPMPLGYRASTQDWVTKQLLNYPKEAALGFAIADNGRTVLDGLAAALGNESEEGQKRLVLLSGTLNQLKAKWFAGESPNPKTSGKGAVAGLRGMKLKHRDSVGAIQFMQQGPIWKKFQESVNLVEGTLRQFDDRYDFEGRGRQEGSLQRPQRSAGQPRSGLRDLWCWWIDNWLLRMDKTIDEWPARAVKAMRASESAKDPATGGLKQEASQWIERFLMNDKSPAQQMQLPKPYPQHVAAAKGVVNRGSPYGAWNIANSPDNAAGPWD